MKTENSWHHVGRRIRRLRKANGLTIKQLAKGCDLSANAISLVERGKVAPTIMTLCKIAHALGVSAGALFQEICATEVVLRRARSGAPAPGATPTQNTIHLLCGRETPPEAASGISTGADIFATCVSGKTTFEVDDRPYTLEPGDQLAFSRAAWHRWSNQGTETCVLVLAIPPTDPLEDTNDHSSI